MTGVLNMTDFRMPMQSFPSRKPAPMHHGYAPYQSYDGLQPAMSQHQPQQLSPHPAAAAMANRRMSQIPPAYMPSPQYPASPASQHSMTAPTTPYPPSRRMSTATTSTNSTGNNPVSSGFTDIRRSTSSRSAHAQLGYVALMRRQKATVWCDRAQPEDPRLRAQKVAEKKRAFLEVHGAGAGGHTGTLGSGKHKHGGKGTADFSPSTLVGANVPVRLSANEVGDDAEEDSRSDGLLHRRTGSGRSSQGSAHRFPSGYQRPPGPTASNTTSNVNTPDENNLPGVTEHPVPTEEAQKPSSSGKDYAASINSRGSEPEEYFGTVNEMTAPSAVLSAAERAKRAEELKRRGSVDDRSTSMTGVRLFVANPDQ